VKFTKLQKSLDFRYSWLGQWLRIILLENIFGLKVGRATTDVDFAFALDNWEQFRTLKTFLIANADFEESGHIAHQMLLRLPGLKHKYKVDLIPFGGIETSPDTIAWPPDMGVMMNVAGYSDALAAAVTVEVSPGINIAVASLPGVAILKLFAWADRGGKTRRTQLTWFRCCVTITKRATRAGFMRKQARLQRLKQPGMT